MKSLALFSCVRGPRSLASLACLAALGVGVAGVGSSAQAQTWTRLTHNAPQAVNLMLLLTDGTVMACRNDATGTLYTNWYRLTPDSTGSYVNGTWTTLATAHDQRLYFGSQVLRDGRVFVAGGEYGGGTARAEVYDPQTNVWTQLPVPTTILDPSQASPVTGLNQSFYDSNTELLPDGRVLIMPVNPRTSGVPVIWNPVTNVWSNAPQLFRGGFQDEATWVKLPDQSILTIDPFGTNSERYSPSLNAWINDGTVPVALYDPFGSELGASFLLADGRAFFLGSTGHTAHYAPSGNNNPGVWTAGPDIPAAHGTPDAPACMLVTGHILCAVSPVPTSGNHFPAPTTFYEYDPVANAFTSVPAPVGTSDNIPSYKSAMLALPDGNVLYSHMGVDAYVYHPAGAPLAAARPVAQTLTMNADGSFHLTGTGFNGISEGAAYGDDFQMSTNYPLIRITASDGTVHFARTYNWSSTGVMTGTQEVSVEYQVPTLPPGANSAVVVTNGVASDPFDPVNAGPIVTLFGTGANSFTDTTGNGNANSRIDPGESDIRVSVGVRNAGNIPATGVSATLVSGVSTVTVTAAASPYPNLQPGTSAANSTAFVLNVAGNHPCGATIPLTLNVTCDQATATYTFSFPTGLAGGGGPFTESYTGPVVPIPDNNGGIAVVNLPVSGYAGTISDLNFRFDGSSCTNVQGATTVGLDHSFVGDLTMTLTSPAGTQVTLMSRPGGANNSGNNFCQTVLDDQAPAAFQTVSSAAAPFTGSYHPIGLLSSFNGQSPNGTWTLRATDAALGDTGNIRAFSLVLNTVGSPICVPPRSTCGSADFNCDGDFGTDADIESFFACVAGNCPAAPCASTADFNGDGDIGTDADIEAFFRVLAGGNC